ncbi:MAG: hypothetical protein Q9225_005712 [Loekoesia sp. 1 TL-2023]
MIHLESHRRRLGPYPPSSRRNRHYDNHLARRSGLKASAFVPSGFSWLDGRGRPGPTSRDYAVLQSITASPKDRTSGLSVEEAFTLAEKALEGRVRKWIKCVFKNSAPMTSAQKRKLPFQIFDELDKEFFRSVLKGNVSLGWLELPSGILSRTIRAGQKRNPRIRIELSPLLGLDGTRCDVLAALIHQMVHAYYLQCCGYRDRGFGGKGHDLEHEQPFHALLKCVSEHCEPLRQHLSADLWASRRYNRGQRPCDPASGISSCYNRDTRFNSIDIEDWRNVAIAETESQQEAQKSKSTGTLDENRFFPRNLYFVDKDGVENPPKSLENWQYPREAYIFLLFDDRCYPVARSSVRDLAALTTSPYFKDKLWLQLPQGTSEAEFLAFYFFLVYGTYPPFLKELNAALGPYGLTTQNPPKIKPYDANAPTQMISLITAFHLGKGLRYTPFCTFVLEGLQSLRATAEDPIAALEMIYGSRKSGDQFTISKPAESPDPDLRKWARAWLAVKLQSADMGQFEACYKTNLGVLRYHPDWSARYAQLKASSPELGQDETTAEHNILLKNGGDSRILRVAMPAPVQRPPTSPEFQHSWSMQRPTDIPGSFSPLNGSLPGLQGEVPPLHRSYDNFDLSSLLKDLPREYVQGLVEKSRPSSDAGSYPESFQNQELSQLMREQALRHNLGAYGGNIPYNILYQQAHPNFRPPANGQGPSS